MLAIPPSSIRLLDSLRRQKRTGEGGDVDRLVATHCDHVHERVQARMGERALHESQCAHVRNAVRGEAAARRV